MAFTHCPAWSAVNIDGKPYPHVVANGAYTMPFNLSGHPAVIIPMGQTQDGLPIGMQIVGKRWREMELLAIAQELDPTFGRLANRANNIFDSWQKGTVKLVFGCH